MSTFEFAVVCFLAMFGFCCLLVLALVWIFGRDPDEERLVRLGDGWEWLEPASRRGKAWRN